MKLRLLTTLVVVCAVPSTAQAGGWARGEEQVFVRLGAGIFIGQQPFELTTGPSGTFLGVAAEAYAEFGLGQNLELDVSTRYVSNTHMLDDGTDLTHSGPEEFEFLLKWAPINQTSALSLLVGSRVALYDRISEERSLTGEPQLGPGGVDFLTGLSFGHSFHPLPLWFNLDLLHRLRFDSPSSGLLIRGEFGARAFERIAAAATLELQPAFGREIDSPEGSPSPVPKAFGVGLKLFGTLIYGFGAIFDFLWFPDVLNDGPGFRFGLGLTYED